MHRDESNKNQLDYILTYKIKNIYSNSTKSNFSKFQILNYSLVNSNKNVWNLTRPLCLVCQLFQLKNKPNTLFSSLSFPSLLNKQRCTPLLTPPLTFPSFLLLSLLIHCSNIMLIHLNPSIPSSIQTKKIISLQTPSLPFPLIPQHQTKR